MLVPTSREHHMPATGPDTQRAFTLVEVAIVLVIIGLVMGGVFKGQALIDSARVRAVAAEMSGFQAAWLAFTERYRAIPGDFSRADAQIDSDARPGNGNGRLDSAGERAGVWQHLALAGFIKGGYDGSAAAIGSEQDLACAANTCPGNPWNGHYKIAQGTQAVNADVPYNEITTGDQVPVGILAQLDARLDDGHASKGRFRVHRRHAASCTRNGQWHVTSANANCAAVLRF